MVMDPHQNLNRFLYLIQHVCVYVVLKIQPFTYLSGLLDHATLIKRTHAYSPVVIYVGLVTEIFLTFPVDQNTWCTSVKLRTLMIFTGTTTRWKAINVEISEKTLTDHLESWAVAVVMFHCCDKSRLRSSPPPILSSPNCQLMEGVLFTGSKNLIMFTQNFKICLS